MWVTLLIHDSSVYYIITPSDVTSAYFNVLYLVCIDLYQYTLYSHQFILIRLFQMSQPWHQWPMDLPSSNQSVDPELQKQYNVITDLSFQRTLSHEQRQRFLHTMQQHDTAHACVLMAGGTSRDYELYDTDVEKTYFRQESFFRYLFMINEPDCCGMIELTTNKSILFVPRMADDTQRWSGEHKSSKWYCDTYGVDYTYYTDEINNVLQEYQIQLIYRLYGTNSDSGNATRTTITFDNIGTYKLNDKLLYELLEQQRIIKTPNEIKLLRIGNLISSQAHVYVMRHIQSNTYELQLEMLYKSYTGFYGGARHCAYSCICGSGHNGATLHYINNNKLLTDNDMCVLDMVCIH